MAPSLAVPQPLYILMPLGFRFVSAHEPLLLLPQLYDSCFCVCKMPEEYMNLSINGRSQVPPGFRFHPTEEELLHYYLRKKLLYQEIDLNVIREVDLNKLEPWDIQEMCKLGSTPQNDWYFFSHKDRKYPTGTRTNRATTAGFWKATGRDKNIYSGFKRIGLRKTLVFYAGRAPRGQKSDWIMHEYRIDDNGFDLTGILVQEEGWVVCRVFKKKNHHKGFHDSENDPISMNSKTPSQNLYSDHNRGLDELIAYMGMSWNAPDDSASQQNQLLDQIIADPFYNQSRDLVPSDQPYVEAQTVPIDGESGSSSSTRVTETNDWISLDRLVASHLNG